MERTTTIKVTLRHPEKVTEDDLITAILAIESWYNAYHEFRIWLGPPGEVADHRWDPGPYGTCRRCGTNPDIALPREQHPQERIR